MGEGSFFSGIGELIDKIKSPPDLLLIIGLGLFGLGAFKGPFALTNALISWGLICMSGGMGLRLLVNSISRFSVDNESYRIIQWGNLLGGVVLLLGCAEFLLHQFSGHWWLWAR